MKHLAAFPISGTSLPINVVAAFTAEAVTTPAEFGRSRICARLVAKNRRRARRSRR